MAAGYSSAGHRPGFAARKAAKGGSGVSVKAAPVMDAKAARAVWVRAIDLAGRCARLAMGAAGPGGEPAADAGDLARMAVVLRDLTPTNFTLPFASAQAQAQAFLTLARMFANPAIGPQARAQMGEFMAAAAAALDRLMDGLRADEARAGRACLGERED